MIIVMYGEWCLCNATSAAVAYAIIGLDFDGKEAA